MNMLLSRLLAIGLCAFNLTGCGAPAAEVPAEPPAPIVQPPAPVPEVDPAEEYVKTLSLEQQIAQLFFARCPETDAQALAQQYDIGGYILFGRDFENQTPDSLRQTLAGYQSAAKTPMLIGVDEEGGTVVRASAYGAFRSEKFRSPQSLFQEGAIEEVLQDCAEKDAFLQDLGINVNLAPVADVSVSPNDFIYARSFGQDAKMTADYIKLVVEQMKSDGMGMTLKHFPGYGNNVDTHTGIAYDERSMESFEQSDLLPFRAGIDAGAQSILVCHNIVACMDDALPASLSPAVHKLLREQLGFDGVIMTDDLIMDAITQYTDGADAAVLAVQADNDLLISSDFVSQYNAVLAAVQAGTISADAIATHAERVVRWKMALGLISA